MKTSDARRAAIVSLLPPNPTLIVDVGADHGHLAAAVGAIAVERRPHRRSAASLPWVITDGLSAFREVPVAVIAGIGARTIAAILERGVAPVVAILHAPDDPGLLRTLVVTAGWRLEAEALAPEGPRYAEIVRVSRGAEPSSGLHLLHGPHLLEGHDPHREAWLGTKIAALEARRPQVRLGPPATLARLDADLAFLRSQLR